jgi:toxin ParE1/3/4
VGSFRISLRAQAQLIHIYETTEYKFGAYQAEAYYAGLERTFGLLSDFPSMGLRVDELALGHRRFRFQSHYVFYTAIENQIVIRAIFHCAQKIRPRLFE